MKRLAILLVTAAAFSGCSTTTQVHLDQRLSALCAIDGGVTISETVSRPPSAFDRNGFINFYRPDRGERALGDDLLYKVEHRRLEPGTDDGSKARLTRFEARVLRKSDGKLLAKAVSYNRFGGDFANPGQPSSMSCPEPNAERMLLDRLFIVAPPQ